MKKIITAILLLFTLNCIAQNDGNTGGSGNNTFKISPQMISSLLLKNPTIQMLEATFPQWSSYQDNSDRELGMKGYEMEGDNYISIEYNVKTYKLNKLIISRCSEFQIKSFKQLLIKNGYTLNVKLSELSLKISGEYKEYYTKKGSLITFVLSDNQIKAFKDSK